MMRRTFIALIVLSVFCLSNVALAAGGTFNDVPEKHWAYEAINKLSKDGIIDGYGDSMFRGDKPLTRYEFAVLIDKALSRYDQASDADKKLIDKLSSEFAAELNRMEIRVKNLEDKAPKVAFSGMVIERYDYTKNPGQFAVNDPRPELVGIKNKKVLFRHRVDLNMMADVAPNMKFIGSLYAENVAGTHPSNTYASLDVGYLTAANVGMFSEVSAGRMGELLGKGLTLWSPYVDGVRVGFGKEVKVRAAVASVYPLQYYYGDVAYAANKNLDFTYAYLQDKHSETYKTSAVGATYKTDNGLALSGEYGDNNSNSNSKKAFYVSLKYKNVNSEQVGSSAVWIMYKKAEPGFDPYSNAILTSTWNQTLGPAGGRADDIKGFEYGLATTIFPHGVLEVKYNPLKSYDGKTDNTYLVSQLTYTF
ncbi:hypothetical protein SCACP_36360 [Sporomusa carbonis]|uniref:S-layer homology domain-containing protein n=1 Tax=Sporomusa carbonis TaxID=3076075 RepID=UPI003A743DBF